MGKFTEEKKLVRADFYALENATLDEIEYIIK